MKYFKTLEDYLSKLPGIQMPLSTGESPDGLWWVKFSFDLDNPLAWDVVQELGHVLNYLSLNDRLPTVFYPVSPPPYLNGGPNEFLSWIIETKDKEFKPSQVANWLEERLPKPVDDLSQWETED